MYAEQSPLPCAMATVLEDTSIDCGWFEPGDFDTERAGTLSTSGCRHPVLVPEGGDLSLNARSDRPLY